MSNGANSFHKQLRTELEDYIKSQYFGKSPLLLSVLSDRIDDEGLLYQKPFIESSPAYVTVQNGIKTASIEPSLSLLVMLMLSTLSHMPFKRFLMICNAFSPQKPQKYFTNLLD